MANKNKLLKELEQLKQEILEHNNYYYNWDQPKISDFEYDQLLKRLVEIENQHPELKSPDSPSQKLPGQALSHFKQAPHSKAMLSLQNSYSVEDIKAFYYRILKLLKGQKAEFFLSPKLDGMAVELIYKKGLFEKALSRGDGLIGEDITAQVKTIKNLPLSLNNKKPFPELLEVRGELILFKKDFEKINQELELAGLPLFANPRNLTAGSVRQLDPKITASRPLKGFIHSIGKAPKGLKSQEEFLTQSLSWGLPVFRITKKLKVPLENPVQNFWKLCCVSSSLEDLISYYQALQALRSKLPFEIDGIVMALNDLEQQKQLGETSTSPRWALAGKFVPEQAPTVLKKIHVQVGRTGAITPVALLEPVILGGVKIRHASLHNFQWLEEKDLREGDQVLIHRAGDVIPEILKSLKRSKNSQKFLAPKNCPVCSQALKKQGDYLFCRFSECPAVLQNQWIHFVGKKAMNIEFLGKKSIQRFYEWGWIKSYSDIYDLKNKNLKAKEGFGKKSQQLLIESLEKSKQSSLKRLIFALGIPLVGESTAQSLSQFIYKKDPQCELLKAIALLSSLSREELESIEDIGPLVAQSFKKAFENPELIADLKRLHKRGIKLRPPALPTDILKGISFVITGTLPLSRQELKTKISESGGRVLAQVSSQTDFLIAGEKPGSKRQKALELSVPLLSYQDFLKRFRGIF